MAHIAHPFSECQQMDAIKPRRCSLAGHRSRVWEGWPLCRAYGLVFTADSCNWEEERIMGAPNFPVSRQRREHGRTPRAHERKSQKKKRKRKKKALHIYWENSNIYVMLLKIIKSQQNKGSLLKEIWGAQRAKWKLCFQGKAGLVPCT